MRIATHDGSALPTVKAICKHRKMELEVVDSLKGAFNVKMDGLLLLGGADINPQFYGERATFTAGVDQDRDAVEWVLIRKALTLGIPIMGICRGHQMLTVATGGALYQDLRGDSVSKRHSMYHKLVDIKRPFGKWIAADRVNSLHHQAVKRVPDGFTVMAKSEDNVIEAIWRPGALGVQFHPEMMFTYDHRWIGLFKWFASGLK
jgi:putative glutamine amidotransferase